MSRTFLIGAGLLGLTLVPSVAAGQNLPGYDIVAFYKERLKEQQWLLKGAVELEQGDTKLYADEVEVFEGEDRIVARGNVVLTQGTSRIAADRVDYNTKTRLGTFHSASGIAAQQPGRPAIQSTGMVVPQAIGQDTDVYFFGETIEKIAPKKYKITNGGFSTCVQPTPRWELSADTIVLNVDDYTLLRQAIFNVKGVPMFYLPLFYYPTQEDGRATGFLLPTYSNGNVEGHTITNAFFWAINRSMDATVFHDYFSKTGGRIGTEYRYNLGGGSEGSITASGLDSRASSYLQNGTPVTVPAIRSYTANGSANHLFPGRFRLNAFVNYFSSVVSHQLYSADIYAASDSRRYYGANLVGGWRSYSLNATFDRTESFGSVSSSRIGGNSPRITLSRNERPIKARSPVYFSMRGEAVHLDSVTDNNGVIDDRSLWRFDFFPRIRYPIKKWTWFTVNTSASWRNTFDTRSLDRETRLPVDESFSRQYFTLQADAIGPVFARVWDTPNSGYAERFKHTIEPTLGVERTSFVDIDRTIHDGSNAVVGTTTVRYGLNNRFYAKRRIGQISQAQEIVTFSIAQSYYADSKAKLFDIRHNSNVTAPSAAAQSNFSDISLGARVATAPHISGDFRGEVDSKRIELRSISAGANYGVPQLLTTYMRWYQTFFVPGVNSPDSLVQSVNFGTNLQTRNNRYGVNYGGFYDIRRGQMVDQNIAAFYNAQCCGIAIQYRRAAGSPPNATSFVPAVNRFFLSFTLAGLGNFSPVGGMNQGGRR
jgi:LPS-assembly protein